MPPLGTNARIAVLSGAAILLGTWNLVGWTDGADAARSGPTPEPELVGAAGPNEGVNAAAVPIVQEQARPADGIRAADAAYPPRAEHVPGAETAPGAEDAVPPAFGSLLDQVFAPQRCVVPESGQRAPMPQVMESQAEIVAERAVMRDGVMAISKPGTATATPDTANGSPEARRREVTEKACYEDFQALAKKDVQELMRQADAVLREDGADCRKVAMLRVLYATDRASALDYFTRAINTLPDRPRPEGISVPAYAVGFLCKQTGDPAMKSVAERIAWSNYLNVSPELRSTAAEALLAIATPADLQRYAGYPAFQAVAAKQTEATP